MTILVFGRTGQVAQELRRIAPVIALGREHVDLSIAGACASAIEQFAPAAVINAAAYTAVDRAEIEESLALQINGAAPAEMAHACSVREIPFIHISTDYVFDGTGTTPWSPGDTTGPLSAYGRSKLAGEKGVAAAGGANVILRTSWVFSAHGRNFVKTMLQLGRERTELRVVSDQIGGPTPATSIAQACLTIAHRLSQDPNKAGVYHFAGKPSSSWADFARVIFAQAKMDCTVAEISTSDYAQPVRRPANSRLDCSKTEAVFGITMPDWQSDLGTVVEKLKQTEIGR